MYLGDQQSSANNGHSHEGCETWPPKTRFFSEAEKTSSLWADAKWLQDRHEMRMHKLLARWHAYLSETSGGDKQWNRTGPKQSISCMFAHMLRWFGVNVAIVSIQMSGLLGGWIDVQGNSICIHLSIDLYRCHGPQLEQAE